MRVPKAASTTISRWFEDLGDSPKPVHNRPLPMFGHYRYKTLAFVRNPYDRLVSAWADKVFVGKGGGHSLGGPGLDNPSFEEFVRRLEAISLADADAHIRPQSVLLREVRLDFLGHFETLESDLTRLAQELGTYAPPPPHLNSTGDVARGRAVLDVKTRARIAELYRDDFERYGYDPHQSP